jgi:hypothetical protein
MVVPVRVRIAGAKNDQPLLAHTLDANESGVRLAGFRGEVSIGDVIGIQYHCERAMFRVVWIHALENSAEKHVGAECIDPDKNIWSVNFPQQTDQYEKQE